MIDCIRGNVPEFITPDDDVKLVFEGWEALCQKYAQPVFFEKSPQHPHHWAALDLMLKWMKYTEFDVRFIILIRNPMAVIYSASKLFSTHPFQRQFGWANCYRNILTMQAIADEERFHLVRYEDLIIHPKQIFGEICDYLGLDHHENMGESVHGRSSHRWIDDLTFTLQLHESVVHVAEHFGYAEADFNNPPKPGLTMHKKISRCLRGSLKLAAARIYHRVIKPILMCTVQCK